MTHHTKPLPLIGADVEASSPPAARGKTAALPRIRKAVPSAQARLAVSLAIALRYRAARALLSTPGMPSPDV